jgi:formate dehydrogenase major subunit
LALGGLIDLSTVRAVTQQLKLSNVNEFTTSCNFCSCGCGMIAAVRNGKLIAMEGDNDHVVKRGSLCVKSISRFATHPSRNRLTTPRYRAPGSDHWEEISWEDAVDRVEQKTRKTRDTTWIATEKLGDAEVPVNRTNAFAFMGWRSEHQRGMLPVPESGRDCLVLPTLSTRLRLNPAGDDSASAAKHYPALE